MQKSLEIDPSSFLLPRILKSDAFLSTIKMACCDSVKLKELTCAGALAREVSTTELLVGQQQDHLRCRDWVSALRASSKQRTLYVKNCSSDWSSQLSFTLNKYVQEKAEI